MASSQVLFCPRCEGNRAHKGVEWQEAAGLSPGEQLSGFTNDLLNTVTFGASNRLFGHAYECETCGHYRSTNNQCETKNCGH